MNGIVWTLLFLVWIGTFFQSYEASTNPTSVSLTHQGKEFYVGFLGIYYRGNPNALIFVTALDKAAKVNVTNYGAGGSTSTYTINAASTVQILFNLAEVYQRDNGKTTKLAYVTSDEDITIIAYFADQYRGGGYRVYPTAMYGKEYLLNIYSPSSSMITILAKEDNTQISIKFPKTTKIYFNGANSFHDSIVTTLNKGEGYYLAPNTIEDISGTIVSSTQNIGLIRGEKCFRTSSTRSGCHSSIEQSVPVEYYKKEFILTPVAERTSGDIYRIVAAYNSTTVTLSHNGATYNLSRTDYKEILLPSGTTSQLDCSMPCSIIHLTREYFQDNVVAGPLSIFMPGVNSYAPNYKFYVPVNSTLAFRQNYINIVVKSSYIDGFLLDGNSIQSSMFQMVTASSYATATLRISPGFHTVNHLKSGVNFALTMYGHGTLYTSYGFVGGITFASLSIEEHPNSTDVVERFDATLRCKAKGNKLISTAWFKDNIQISNYVNSSYIVDNDWNITNAAFADAGNYSCRVWMGSLALISNIAEVRVKAYLAINQQPISTEFQEGEQLNLQCNATGVSSLISITWYKDNVVLHDYMNTTLPGYSQLRVLNATSNDAGNYYCLFSMLSYTYKSQIANLDFHYKPKFVSSSRNFNFTGGQSALLSCNASGNPLPVWTWIMNDTAISGYVNLSSSSYSTLSLNNISSSEVGYYKCKAENYIGADIRNVGEVDIYRIPTTKYNFKEIFLMLKSIGLPKFTSLTVNLTVVEGDSITLFCNSSGNPIPVVKWQMNRVKLNSSNIAQISVRGNGQLTITNVSRSQAGFYQCESENLVGTAYANPIGVDVLYKPVVTLSPLSLNKTEGDTIIISCNATGNPYPTWIWLKNNQTIVDYTNSSSSAYSTLKLQNVSSLDVGSYQCRAENTIAKPVVVVSPRNYNMTHGESVTLSCNATGNPSPTLTWLKNGQSIIGFMNTSSLSYTTLTLLNVSRIDVGIYRCLGENIAGSSSSSSIIDIYTYPRVVSILNNTEVVEGNTITLSCNSTGYPTPVISWYKDDILVAMSNIIQTSVNGYGQLIIANISTIGIGKYTCAIKLLNKQYIMFWSFSKANIALPKLINIPRNTGIIEEGIAALTCNSIGRPIPVITWLRNRIAVNFSNTIQDSANGSSTLTILNITKSQSGQYQCVASNWVGNVTSVPAVVDVYYKPLITVSLQSQNRANGESLTLSCNATGNPSPTWTWLKNNQIINYTNISSDHAELTLYNLSSADIGNYRCSATNIAGTASSSNGFIDVYTMPVITASTSNVVVNEGGISILTCNVSGNPIPEIIWLKNSTAITYSNARQISSNGYGVLTISNISVSQAGFYECSAKNLMGTIYGSIGEVVVYYKPIITVSPESNNVTEGQSLMLSCNATSNPGSSWIWLRNDQIVTFVNATSSYTTLALLNVSGIEAGRYKCQATNEVDTSTSSAAIINVYTYPRFVMSPRNQTKILGQQITLSCNSTSNPYPNITWFKDDSLLNKTAYQYFSLTGYSTLTINNSSLADEGQYHCRADNFIGQATSNIATVVIEIPPTVLLSPISRVVLLGETVILTCEGTGKPSPTVTWTKGGQAISNAVSNSLTIGNVTAKDSADYRCLFNNSAGSVLTQASTINVFTVPIILHQTTSLRVIHGGMIRLICNTSSLPSASIIWQRNNTALDNGLSSTMTSFQADGITMASSTLIINSVTLFDAGNYSCWIQNAFSSATSPNISVVVMVPPAAISKITVSNITASALNVSWLPPSFNGYTTITNYTVEIILQFNNTVINQSCYDSLISNGCVITFPFTTITSLIPYQNYSINIWASNIAGNGRKMAITVQTDESAPASMVRNIVALGYNATSIQIIWDSPALSYGIVGYRLYQWIYVNSSRSLSLNSSGVMIFDGTTRSVYSTGLQQDQYYYYKIIPYNIKYNLTGPESNIVNATTHEYAPSSPPVNVIATVLSSTSIRLSWQPPVISDRNGVITAYEIDYEITGSNVTMSASASGGILTYTINNLKAYTNYSLTIKAGTVAGFGPSITVTAVTDEAAPSSTPINTIATVLSSTGIKLSWQPPVISDRNGVITAYEIDYKITGSNVTMSASASGGTLTYTINNLKAYTNYSLTIKAGTVAGFGPSITVTAVTDEA
ncbi:Hemicentin-2, partial [Trichoplax sp. H2]